MVLKTKFEEIVKYIDKIEDQSLELIQFFKLFYKESIVH